MKNEIFRIEYRDVLDVLKDSEKLVKKIEDLYEEYKKKKEV